MRRRAGAWALAAATLAVAGCAPDVLSPEPPQPPPAPDLIDRSALFSGPGRDAPRLSPDGGRIAFLAPLAGVMNIWSVERAALGAARPLTRESGGPVSDFAWSSDGATILYVAPAPGGRQRLSAVRADGAAAPIVLAEAGVVEVLATPATDPTGALVRLDLRDAAWPDVYRIDLQTGARTRLETNTRRFFRYVVDLEGRVRLGLSMLGDGQIAVWTRNSGAPWRRLFNIPAEDALTSSPLSFEAGGTSFLMLDSAGRDRAALVRVDAETGARAVLGESARADVREVWLDPQTGAAQAFAANYLRRDWRALNESAQADLAFLSAHLSGEASVVSRSRDDAFWIVTEDGPTTPPQSYLYERRAEETGRLTLLFRHYRDLGYAPLQMMTPVEIEARDGLTLVSYLTLPPGADDDGDLRPVAPGPLVILSNSTPWTREAYGFNALHQWLANRGYAVLSVNVRGSMGFGRSFLNAGDRQWGGAMQDDLVDAARWAVTRGVAQPDRIALFGEQFGGFAAVSGLASTPDRYACAVARAAPLNLENAALALPAGQEWMRPLYYARIGDPRTEQGRAALRSRAPVLLASAITRPLLLMAVGRDAGAARSESDGLAQAANVRRAGLVYVVYPDEQARFSRPAVRLSFIATAEQFLAACLGGAAEPLSDAFEGVRAQTLFGAQRIAGLRQSAPPPPPPPPSSPVALEGQAAPVYQEAPYAPAFLGNPLSPLEPEAQSLMPQ